MMFFVATICIVITVILLILALFVLFFLYYEEGSISLPQLFIGVAIVLGAIISIIAISVHHLTITP